MKHDMEIGDGVSKIMKRNTKEHNKKISLAKMGHFVSIATRKKISEAQKGERCHFWKGGKTIVNCHFCDKTFKTFPSNVMRGKGKYCSVTCMHKANIGRHRTEKQKMNAYHVPKGNKIHLGFRHSEETKKKMSMTHQGITDEKEWKGFNASLDKLEREKFRGIMQKQILERDNYTCQLCGIRGGDLQVDHIQSWAEYVELRFSMDNCRTLCASCHYEITFDRRMPKEIKGWGHNLLRGGI